MKNKFTKVVFWIFIVCMLIYLFAVGYFKNNNSNMNDLLVYIVVIIFCIACITGVILIIIGIRNMIIFLKRSGNISMKKIICLLIVLGLGSYCGGEMLAQHKVASQKNNSANSEVSTANSQQNDDSKDQTDNTSDTPTDTSTSDTYTQNNNTDNSSNTNTPNISSSGKLTSPDGYLELENKTGNYDNITGTIKNLSSEPYRYVEVNINLYDSNGNQVESTLANTNNLEGNGTWNFSAPVLYPDKSTKLKVISIEGNR